MPPSSFFSGKEFKRINNNKNQDKEDEQIEKKKSHGAALGSWCQHISRLRSSTLFLHILLPARFRLQRLVLLGSCTLLGFQLSTSSCSTKSCRKPTRGRWVRTGEDETAATDPFNHTLLMNQSHYLSVYRWTCWTEGHTKARPPGTSNGRLWQHPIRLRENEVINYLSLSPSFYRLEISFWAWNDRNHDEKT